MEKLLSDAEREKLLSLIGQSEKIVVSAHVSPDGDAVGSALAVGSWLGRKGKEVQIILPTAFPDFLKWMPGAEHIKIFNGHEATYKPLVEQADLIVIVDMNQPSRLTVMEETVTKSKAARVMIDHHLMPDEWCDLTISHPEMCATAEILCHMLWQLGEMESLTREEATCLYTSMMCDTGAFTYASSRPAIFDCVSRLLEKDIDKDRIYRRVYWSGTESRIRLQGYLLYTKLEVLHELHASIMSMDNKERKLFGVKNGDTEGFVNLPLQIQGMKLSIFLNQDSEHPEIIKVSLRSVDDFPCNEMSARFFHGGGHLNASGGRLQCPMEEAITQAKEAIRAFAPLLRS